MATNVAAPAVREAFSLRSFDHDISVGIAFPGAYGNTDFNNRGENGDPRLVQRTDRFWYLNAGLQLQFGQLGITAMGDFLSYEVTSPSQGTSSLSLTLGKIHAAAAYALLDHQLVLGAGARIVLFDLGGSVGQGSLLQMAGVGPEVGAIVKPNGTPFRVGATLRSPVSAGNISAGHTVVDPSTGVSSAGGFIVPDRITQPWELEAGIAWQFGSRPLNPPWIEPEKDERELARRIAENRAARAAERNRELSRMPRRTAADLSVRAARAKVLEGEEKDLRDDEDLELEGAKDLLYQRRKARYLNWPRDYVLVLASMTLTGASSRGVALEGFLDQKRELVGRTLTIAPRVAAESELVPNLIRTRAGVYFEPSRFEDGTYRQHFTFGADLKLLSWDLLGIIPGQTWRLTAFVDMAPRYQNFGFAIGAWH